MWMIRGMSDVHRPALLTDLPVVTPAEPVPVYDCHVIFSGPDAEGRLHGRVTNLPDLSANARSERELLTQLVRRFKQTITQCRTEGREVPWLRDRVRPAVGEHQRWIPVHL
jgi:hypothetical protein